MSARTVPEEYISVALCDCLDTTTHSHSSCNYDRSVQDAFEAIALDDYAPPNHVRLLRPKRIANRCKVVCVQFRRVPFRTLRQSRSSLTTQIVSNLIADNVYERRLHAFRGDGTRRTR